MIELYGILDPLTRDWTDGLLSNIFREMNKPLDESSKEEKRYILFDGDVDALWIENMNSVMDDNKILTLANQERIKLQNYCSLLFEVGDLQYASPATVSRAGMVYVDPKNLGWQPFMDKWINGREEDQQKLLRELADKYVEGGLKLIIDAMLGMQQVTPLKMIIQQTALNMVHQLCKMIDALYPTRAEEDEDETAKPSSERQASDDSDIIKDTFFDKNEFLEAVYIQACYCSLGAALVVESRPQFDEFMKKTSGLMMVEDTPEKLATISENKLNYLFNSLMKIISPSVFQFSLTFPQFFRTFLLFFPTSWNA